jgi:hypothetical protein
MFVPKKNPAARPKDVQEKLQSFYSMIQFLLLCPTSALKKIFNPQNMLYIPPVKNCFRLEFEQIP